MPDRGDGAPVELHFLRHAHAGNPESWSGPDARRPLSAKGERQAERLGRFLASVGFRPDALITSPKVLAALGKKPVARIRWPSGPAASASIVYSPRLPPSPSGARAKMAQCDPSGPRR